MSTITLGHLSEPQRQALQGPAPLSPDHLDGLATRFRAARTEARLFDRPVVAHVMAGYAKLAADLARCDARTEWRLAWQLARIWSEHPDAYSTATPFAAGAAAALKARSRTDDLERPVRYSRDPVYGCFVGELPFARLADFEDDHQEQAA